MEKLLLANQAVARGAWEAGVRVAAAYPGTPSTEITEAIAQYTEVNTEWAPNEKVALEVAFGAAVGGARSLVCMKHVGLNVAADPLFTGAYTGIRAGLVLVVADDPGMHSSQNEQDSRYYARSAHLPMLEPADSAQCALFTKMAFEVSEAFDTPVLIRLTTRIAHSSSLVELHDRVEVPLKPYEKDFMKYVMMPGMARLRHVEVEKRMRLLEKESNRDRWIIEELRDTKLGVVTSGIVSQYVREALPEVSILQLGMVYPTPVERIRAFSEKVDRLVVCEELEPFLQEQMTLAGIPAEGKELFSVQGEYTARGIAAVLGNPAPAREAASDLPARPPVLCPGCPHRASFYVMKQLGLTVMGDIGCYTLGASPPLSSMDSTLCMGASIGMAFGMEKAMGPQAAKKIVAVIGDSTFIHSGMTGLADVVYNNGRTTVVILDNTTTGMTGHQNHAANGLDLHGQPTSHQIDLEALCRALGVELVLTTDPFDLKKTRATLKQALDFEGPAVVILRRPCILLPQADRKGSVAVDAEKCRRCGRCMGLGCPALEMKESSVAVNPTLCVGCGLCMELCAFGAIREDHE